MTGWNINKKLAMARINKGLTQSQAASALNCCQSDICRKEKGNRRIYAWELVKLAELYNVDITYFYED